MCLLASLNYIPVSLVDCHNSLCSCCLWCVLHPQAQDKLLAIFLSFSIIAHAQKWSHPALPKGISGKRDFHDSIMCHSFTFGGLPFAHPYLRIFFPPSLLFANSMAGGRRGMTLQDLLFHFRRTNYQYSKQLFLIYYFCDCT